VVVGVVVRSVRILSKTHPRGRIFHWQRSLSLKFAEN